MLFSVTWSSPKTSLVQSPCGLSIPTRWRRSTLHRGLRSSRRSRTAARALFLTFSLAWYLARLQRPLTAAAVFRIVEAARPTLLIDEGETFLLKNEELRGILNSGHRRSSARVMRVGGDNLEPREFGRLQLLPLPALAPCLTRSRIGRSE